MRNKALALLAGALLLSITAAGAVQQTLPASLTAKEFWALTERFSEPNGYFRSNSGSPDNLLSNENTLSTVAAQLAGQLKPDGVYLGVGPEQNFTYIAAIRPRLAIITDIRRGNLHLHLLYKAAFELTTNRADFLAMLFSRKRPAGLTATSTASQLMNAYLLVDPADESTFKANLKRVIDHLKTTRGLPLDEDDVTGIEYVYSHFNRFGPAINYTSSINGRSGSGGSYASIQSARDAVTGAERSYLAGEDSFSVIKTMQGRNLIVPIVGDFAGPKALRAVAAYLKEHDATVSAFYVSNVESYLERNGVWQTFCANVAALPLTAESVFIRPGNVLLNRIGDGRSGPLGPMAAESAACAR